MRRQWFPYVHDRTHEVFGRLGPRIVLDMRTNVLIAPLDEHTANLVERFYLAAILNSKSSLKKKIFINK
ncbi:MAG: hypothetical protein JZU60_03090 [Ilumatobacteraceae bacterium]|jgi:hypothetical protein|nr:hypothetical protein [Ilumatobacteraceae bacterium]